MLYQKGDRIIHWAYGPGQIMGLDEKKLDGETQQYYVVEFNQNLTLWVPVNRGDEHSLRLPTPQNEFKHLFSILRGPAEILPEDRYMRQTELNERLRQGTTEAVCRVIRDITSRGREHKLNDNDVNVLRRAREFLLNEWMLSLNIPLNEAEVHLNSLLDENMHTDD